METAGYFVTLGVRIMDNLPLRVCLLGKESGLADAVARALGPGFETRHPVDLNPVHWIETRDWCEVMLFDARFASAQPDFSAAIRLIDQIQQGASRPPAIVVFCDENDRAFAAKAMEHGAYETVTYGMSIAELRQIIQRAHKANAAEKELDQLRAEVRASGRMHQLLGTTRVMQDLFALAQRIAPCDVNVLITGETGTGKELLARAIHEMSPRERHPMVAFSCTNLPETLIEDELFGHEKGAFTGAHISRRGRFETADQGTLFLDEVGDLGLGLQPKLLRVLQERKFERLGGNTTVSVDVRLISATNRNLSEMVQRREFREDLYYRLNVVQLELPPLRERCDDIHLLAQHFLQATAKQFHKTVLRFSEAALHSIIEYSWPGNVRELENAVQRAVVLCERNTVENWHLPSAIRKSTESRLVDQSYEQEVRHFKRRLVLRTLRHCGWNKAESARSLGVARGYLHRLINQLEIRESEESSPVVTREPLFPPKQIM
jgi:DNA-binding NtrC family response regulator